MSLTPGAKVGPYEITAPIGAGGMGEVWRARDTNLGRDVAVKVLPDALADDPKRLARFEREAKILASLNHPNIAAIYGVDKSQNTYAVVMELVEGSTLADRIAQGAIPPDEALPIARQIAEALEAAHEQGIVHRDLKPANVKVKDNGHVKVLDFGLAKAIDLAPASATGFGGQAMAHRDLTNSPTITSPAMTAMGMILGTAAYMSPEQARGKPVDKRADIWAFGCVLFEMLTGRRAFDGPSSAEVLARVLERDVDFNQLPATTPPSIRRLLRRALTKDPKDRLRDAGDARIDIAEALNTSAAHDSADHPIQATRLGWRRAGPWMLIVAGSLAGVLLWFRPVSLTPTGGAAARVQVPLPAGVSLAVDTDHPTLALSPDGSRLVFVGEQGGMRRLYLRRLTDDTARPIPGTEGAASPFFSPDGASVAYIDGGRLERVPLDGGVPLAVHATTEVAVSRGATWVTEDAAVLAASPNSGLQRGSLAGPTERALTEWQRVTPPSALHIWPSALPDGRYVVFTTTTTTAPQESRIERVSLDSGRIEPLVNGGTNPRYSAEHLVYARRSALYAVPFDHRNATVTGAERLVTEGVMTHANGAAQFATSTNGTLAFVAGGAAAAEYSLVWVTRDGRNVVPIRENEGRQYLDPRLSPDETQLAFTSAVGSSLDVFLHAFSNRSLRQLTNHPGEDFDLVWSSDGKRVAVASEVAEDASNQGPGIAWLAIDASASPEPLSRTAGYGHWEMPSSWSRNGWLAFSRTSGRSARDIWIRQMDDPQGREEEVVGGPADEAGAAFSPDGEWIAYSSDDQGHPEIYVRPFKRPGRTHTVSSAGGVEPAWSRDGREIFYRNGNKLMAVGIGPGPELQPEPPRMLFEQRFELKSFGSGSANYDVARDGRFVMVQRRNLVQPTVIEVILNWPAALPASR